MRSSIAALPVLAAVVGAQIDPSSVPLALRSSWCSSQTSQCPLLCSQVTSNHKTSTTSNSCDPKTLTYSCTCVGGITPNASEYSQTIPYFICTQVNENCVKACAGNNACSSDCRQDNPCGAQNPVVANSSSATSTTSGSSSSATAATTTGFGSFGDATTTASTSSTKSAAIAALNLGNTYGVAVVAAGIFAGFGMML
ncbi:hypothetical protein E2P81_ATG11943 [Venturia nashicola]|uniref:DUF7707 domain-containing protein n=1 Tax=Venturia nashicola TaxID=86259 RepID=A0A4Z1NPG7_9PEZI|nr:hypothetical protein E6O75_ATG11636 [Venturia nashicola]TLD24607.1 hypothetical protein E2P81_ATG11943 [Venturia nashicola]